MSKSKIKKLKMFSDFAGKSKHCFSKQLNIQVDDLLCFTIFQNVLFRMVKIARIHAVNTASTRHVKE